MLGRSFRTIYCLTLCLSLGSQTSLYAGEIHEAVKTGDIPALQRLIAEDSAQLDALDERRRTPLELALELENEPAIRILLSALETLMNGINIDILTLLKHSKDALALSEEARGRLMPLIQRFVYIRRHHGLFLCHHLPAQQRFNSLLQRLHSMDLYEECDSVDEESECSASFGEECEGNFVCNPEEQRSGMYAGHVKMAARERIFRHAVQALTKDRDKSCCVPRDYVRKLRDKIITGRDRLDAVEALHAKERHVLEWERFHDTCVQPGKEPKDLSVAYLAGPNFLRDMEVLVELGVLPQNIWAFEKDLKCFEKSKKIGRTDRRFSSLKLFNGDIASFFEQEQRRFDIIYLDFCGTLFSDDKKKGRPMEPTTTAFFRQRLTPLGVLVTNFASPDISKKNQSERFSKLMARYLLHKHSLSGLPSISELQEVQELMDDGPEAHGYNVEGFSESSEEESGLGFSAHVEENFPHYYSESITRVLVDLASGAAPWLRLVGKPKSVPPFWKTLFLKEPSEFEKYYEEDCDFDNSLSWWLFYDSISEKIAGLFKPKGVEPPQVLTAFRCAAFLRSSNDAEKLWSKELQDAFSDGSWFHQFCDVQNPRIVGLLTVLAQHSYPAHYSDTASDRFRYRDETNTMYVDTAVFDECRYVYDWLPSLHLVQNCFEDKSNRLVFQFALDGLGQVIRWLSPEIDPGYHVQGVPLRGLNRRVDLTWYSDEQIRILLEHYLPEGQGYAVIPPAAAVFEDENLLRGAIGNALNQVLLGQVVVMPLHMHGNHWTGAIFRRQPNGAIQVVFNNPTGATLEGEGNTGLFVRIIQEIARGVTEMDADIVDLQLRQQHNDIDCGPFTVDNLVRLARTATDGVDHEAIIANAGLMQPANGRADEIRATHDLIFRATDALLNQAEELLQSDLVARWGGYAASVAGAVWFLTALPKHGR